MKLLYWYWCVLLLGIGCSTTSQESISSAADSTVVAYAPVAVQKTIGKKIFVHLMPWFETDKTNAGTWGIHWTMANQNPDVKDANGRRQIAAHYYPLTGPYASGDSNIIEYQLLLMKLSGIDGVFIDWPGTIDLYDYPRNAANTEKIVALLEKTGLRYAMVYEDQNVNIAFNKGAIPNKIEAAKKDMLYLQNNHFNKPNYEKINGKPLLLDFGPQTFTNPTDWVTIFSSLTTAPSFFPLWGHADRAGTTAIGEFAWINADNTSSLSNFYSNVNTGIKIASAYPGFNTFYKQGGWDGPTFVIAANNTTTFQSTLSMALQSGADYIQLPTWNDYGEGTMIEPTVEFQYGFLTHLQKMLGTTQNETALQLVSKLYENRNKHAGNATKQKKLDQVFYYLVSLQLDKAEHLLNTI